MLAGALHPTILGTNLLGAVAGTANGVLSCDSIIGRVGMGGYGRYPDEYSQAAMGRVEVIFDQATHFGGLQQSATPRVSAIVPVLPESIQSDGHTQVTVDLEVPPSMPVSIWARTSSSYPRIEGNDVTTRTGILYSRPTMAIQGTIAVRSWAAEPLDSWIYKHSVPTLPITTIGSITQSSDIATGTASHMARWRPSRAMGMAGVVSRVRNDFKGAVGPRGAYDAIAGDGGLSPVLFPGWNGYHSALKMN